MVRLLDERASQPAGGEELRLREKKKDDHANVTVSYEHDGGAKSSMVEKQERNKRIL